ncbi:Slp family lipoprotein [Pseudoxanthomonas koreensis]|uniref:Slp family lipoprotein n=1 Tax=Pseudoxanthomonas koreensis TaxID=266061 RepID=UPI0013911440|nr:Slp family lipoprotein [Pseudoxanthomonas koreensis]KAF1695658.1 hypothetical protein CSC64_02735 [Pseudoxanthomonas koreensis]
MTVRIPFRIALVACAALVLGACATAPEPLQGTFPAVTPQQSVGNPQTGPTVRWGGRIIETQPKQDHTCFQVVSMPLTSTGRPDSDSADMTQGRFLACRAGFYDPAVFTAGREVTFVGRIGGTDTVRIGDYDYPLPLVAADVVYLWPEVREVDVITPYYPYWGPYWGPWGGPWGPWGWW